MAISRRECRKTRERRRRMIRKLCLVTAVLALLCLSAASAYAWDVSNDFSTGSNPNGEWAYGGWWDNVFHSGTSITDHRGYAGLNGWGNEDDAPTYYTPYVVQNTNSSTIENLFGAFDLASQAVYMHPGNQGDEGTIRWTAPSAGSYSVSLTFTKLDLVNGAPLDTQIVSIYQGSTLLGSSTLSASNQLWTFSQQLTFAQEQQLFLRVAADGSYDGDSTGVYGSITPVPEPGSLLALGSGFVGAIGCVLRKRHQGC